MAINEILPATRFLEDVKAHEMIVLHDDGVYRHIRFKRPGTGCMHFDLVTWPGYLAYSGDMGCYVFCRLNDMFSFFRTDRNYATAGDLFINLSYWSEKLQAVDGNRRNGAAKEFNKEKFARLISEIRLDWIRERGLNKSDRRELWESVRDRVLNSVDEDDSGHVSMNAAYDFCERIGGKRFQFVDLWEYDFTEYTYRFIWCCYALAWGIKKYDDAKVGVPNVA